MKILRKWLVGFYFAYLATALILAMVLLTASCASVPKDNYRHEVKPYATYIKAGNIPFVYPVFRTRIMLQNIGHYATKATHPDEYY